jgi:hypothetical protein
VGVTTLGIVGETLKGPAFEPIFISNFDEFSAFFGGTSAEKFINTQIPKYEAAYIAKSYLQQSNQLFVTRVLGLSGYDAGPSWSITTIANLDSSTLDYWCTSAVTTNCVTDCVTYKTLPFTITFSGCDNSTSGISYLTSFPTDINNVLYNEYEEYNGSTTTLDADIKAQLLAIMKNPTSSGSSINYYGTVPQSSYTGLSSTYTAETNVFGVSAVNSGSADFTDSVNDPWYYALFTNNNGLYSGYSFYNVVTNLKQTSSLTNCASFYTYSISGNTGSINYDTNTITVYLPSTSGTTAILSGLAATFSACTSDVKVGGVSQVSNTTKNNFSGGTVVYTLTSPDGSVSTNWTVNVTTIDPCNPASTGNTGSINTGTLKTCYSGTVSGTVYYMSGYSYTNYDNLVVSTLRSRGIATYSNDNGAVYEVSGLTNTGIDASGSYSAITKNPFATFRITGSTIDNTSFSFETSLTEGNTNFISKVFGMSNFQKPRTIVPLFVEEEYNAMLIWAWRKGYIRGLNTSFISLPNARQGSDPTSIAWYLEQYQSAQSPWVVSELRGNKVYNLFKFITIGDGNAANDEIKISIANMSFENLTFDILIRDYYDTDSNPVVLEKFTTCTMDPSSNSFIGVKIGTSNGDYDLQSKYIMLEMNEDAPIDALPCGFQGFEFREYSAAKSPTPIYKTKYNYPGEVVYNPPFGTSAGGNNSILSSGDNVRRTYLGLSDTVGYDVDFFQYKGKQLPTSLCTTTTSSDWNYLTKGFHMDINASAITIGNTYTTSGTPAFEVGSASFTSDPSDATNPYYRIYARKFTLMVQGGFDGWDIYREYRTNTDRFSLGASGYLKGACASIKYPSATGWGAFKQIAVGDNTVDYANTDYYAYLLGINTFANPEAVNINVFVTPGIDYVNNSNLAESAIDIIENDRADSLYIVTTPDVNLYLPTVTSEDLIYPQEVVDNLNNTNIDSNYTATYYPWVLTKDSVNNTQIYIPATAEVTRNLALTDNIAFPWFAAAGYTRGIVNAVKARKKLTQEDRDVLYEGRINPIATFSDVGTVIWGNKTLQIKQSALDRINVRRLLLQARKLISAVSVRLLFEQNDDKVRQDFLDAVNPILDAIRRDRGLYDFRVTVSSDTADLDRNQMTGKIYIKPTKSLEFIDITFYLTPTGASFENI